MRDRSAPLSEADVASLAWEKMDGLLPAAVRDHATGEVLMLGYMNDAALSETLRSGFVTFYSRSKGRLWRKGETSGNHLRAVQVRTDCDRDALLVDAEPTGPTCHLGERSCFGGAPMAGPGWLGELSRIVADAAEADAASSYTARLLQAGPARIAQKVGEEGVEVALAAVGRDTAGCAEEVADLLYHLTVLMQARGFGWAEVVGVLQQRRAAAVAGQG